MFLAKIAGWYGAIILFAYGLVGFGFLNSSGIVFQMLNLTGAIGLIILNYYKNIKQSIVLNIFRAGVALIAIVKLLS